MKPTLHIAGRKTNRDSIASMRGTRLPQTDFSFQAGAFGGGSGRSPAQRFPSFRGISDEYFKTEARSHFAVEAAIFGLLVVTVAVPVFQGVRGLIQYVWGIL